jgi:hypothetical protein
MPKKTMEDTKKRSFKVLWTSAEGMVDKESSGRFESRAPSSAAAKAGGRRLKDSKKKEIEVVLQEMSAGSAKKRFAYTVKRVKTDAVDLGDYKFQYKHVTTADKREKVMKQFEKSSEKKKINNEKKKKK